MSDPRFGWTALLLRFIGAVGLVYLTYNPLGYSYYHWALADIPVYNFAHFTAVKTFVGILLLIGWFGYIKVTQRALGMLGIVLTVALFGSFIWVLIEYQLVSVRSTKAITHVVLIVLSAVLAVGMSWSHIRRRLSGQVVTDDIDH